MRNNIDFVSMLSIFSLIFGCALAFTFIAVHVIREDDKFLGWGVKTFIVSLGLSAVITAIDCFIRMMELW